MIISNKILTTQQFVECYTGCYFTECDTFNEVYRCLASQCIYIKKGYKLTQGADAISDPDKAYVIVKFSSDDDYTEYEYYIMRVQKKFYKRFVKNMTNEGWD